MICFKFRINFHSGVFPGWNNGWEVNPEFKTYHNITQTLNWSEDNKTHHYNITCINRAGNSSTVQISFEVNLNALGVIIFTSPSGSIKETTVTLEVRTNKDANCSYTEAGIPLPFTETGRKIHKETKTGLSEGPHDYPVRCLFEKTISEGIISFRVDLTAPTITIEDGNHSCGTDEVRPEFIAEDVSPISLYNYSLYDSAGNVIIDWTTTSSYDPEIDEDHLGNDLNLTIGKKYYFKAKARDEAGHWSNITTSNGFVVLDQNATECLADKKPPFVKIKKEPTYKGIKVTILCSDESGSELLSYFLLYLCR